MKKKALLLEYLTIIWNVFEGIVCMTIGLMSGSVSLFAYGLESSVEVFASVVTVWQLHGDGGKSQTKKALKMIGVAYLVVSGYVLLDAIHSLFSGHHAQQTILGIIFLSMTVIVMLVLGFMKCTVGQKLNNAVVLADAKFTLIDAALSATVLIGLILNALFSLWWTDQLLAIFLAATACKEGLNELK